MRNALDQEARAYTSYLKCQPFIPQFIFFRKCKGLNSRFASQTRLKGADMAFVIPMEIGAPAFQDMNMISPS